MIMNNTELINSSLEMKHYRRSAVIYGITTLVFLAVIFAVSLASQINGVTVMNGIVWAVVFIPLTVYHIYKAFSLTKDADGYEFYTATLDEAHHTINRKIYLILRVEKPDGGSFRAITSGIFSRSVLSSLYYGEFYKRNINILYNKATDRVIVLGYDGTT